MAVRIGSGVNVQGGSFALLLPLGYGLVASACFAPTNVSGVHICVLHSLVRTTCYRGVKIDIWAFNGFGL